MLPPCVGFQAGDEAGIFGVAPEWAGCFLVYGLGDVGDFIVSALLQWQL
jgi:hypothetical protein